MFKIQIVYLLRNDVTGETVSGRCDVGDVIKEIKSFLYSHKIRKVMEECAEQGLSRIEEAISNEAEREGFTCQVDRDARSVRFIIIIKDESTGEMTEIKLGVDYLIGKNIVYIKRIQITGETVNG